MSDAAIKWTEITLNLAYLLTVWGLVAAMIRRRPGSTGDRPIGERDDAGSHCPGRCAMIPFNFRLFLRLTYLSWFQSRGTQARLTRKRVLFLLSFYAVFVPWQLVNGFFLLLDNILFPGFRRVQVKEPVFIVGPPRSGSTHLLRVLARDDETFASAKLWELLLAPSITQRKIVRALATLDRHLGGPARSWLFAWQERAFQEAGTYHKIRLQEPDEDELSFLPIFSAIHLAFPFPFLEEFARYIYFDQQAPLAERERFMGFYRRLIQRTLYLYGPTKRYLSKTPANSGRVGTLHDTFPDAKFIYTNRDPAAVLPSTLSLFSFQWGVFSDLLEPYPFREEMLEMTKHWYQYTIQRLEQMPADSHTMVMYEDLTSDLEQTITDIYATFDFDVSPAYAQALEEEVRKARRYTSTHHYSLKEMGLTRERIEAEYRDVYARYEFGKRDQRTD